MTPHNGARSQIETTPGQVDGDGESGVRLGVVDGDQRIGWGKEMECFFRGVGVPLSGLAPPHDFSG